VNACARHLCVCVFHMRDKYYDNETAAYRAWKPETALRRRWSKPRLFLSRKKISRRLIEIILNRVHLDHQDHLDHLAILINIIIVIVIAERI